MKKSIILSAIALIITGSAIAQPVSDRVVIPIAVTLNQILRIHVINGGNIEFVFNTIDDYKNGIPNQPMYQSDLVIASSTNWSVDMGAETALWDGTDDPLHLGMFRSDNIGFQLNWTGGNTCCGVASNINFGTHYTNPIDAAGAPSLTPNGLSVYTAPGAEQLLQNGTGNAGDVGDNAFSILWECGTLTGGGVPAIHTSIPGQSLLLQGLPPDRYVSNVLIDLVAQ